MLASIARSALLQFSGEMGAIIALIVALGIAGVAIVWLTTKKNA